MRRQQLHQRDMLYILKFINRENAGKKILQRIYKSSNFNHLRSLLNCENIWKLGQLLLLCCILRSVIDATTNMHR